PLAFDVLALPGGRAGAQTLARDARILETIRSFVKMNKLVAAVCAGPLALLGAGVLNGRRLTCHPDVAPEITEGLWINEPVVVDGLLVTSQGPGTSFLFALSIIRILEGAEKAEKIARGLILPSSF
ncbi:MAG: DJ-1/PfpI family protein, partial [Lentisphaerota bacterium]